MKTKKKNHFFISTQKKNNVKKKKKNHVQIDIQKNIIRLQLGTKFNITINSINVQIVLL